MLVIADGGSSKADWKIVLGQGNMVSATTTGFNPNYDSSERIASLVSSEMNGLPNINLPGQVYYYGTGCWDAGRKAIVEKALKNVFVNSQIHINHDLLAAALATCGNQPGIACILGTGSNSVLFDGEKEIDNVTNLGFLLGDEGSGAYIGKNLVKAFFYREMPEELQPVIEKECPNGRKDILDRIYGGGVPAAYLASFTKLFSEYSNHPFIRNLIKSCFLDFLARHVCKYQGHEKLPIHFVGSIAFHFKDILLEALDEKKLHAGNIIKKPIDDLVKYHIAKI